MTKETISEKQAHAMAQVCLDLHDALGCKWGDNPYLAIDRLKTAAQPAPTVQEPVACQVCGGSGFIECDALQSREKNNGKWGRCLSCQPYTPSAAPTVQEPKEIAALVEGMEVSIDVSTGDHDNGNRLFGTVTLAQENQGSKHGLILLVQDPEANFKTTTPPATQRQWVGLTSDDWNRVAHTSEFRSGAEWADFRLKKKNGVSWLISNC